MTAFRTNSSRAALALAAALTVAGVTGQGARAANTETQSITVDLAGIDLTTASGQALAHRKVFVAAREVCGGWESGNFQDARDARTCRTAAMRDASARIAALAAAQATRIGANKPVAVASK